MDAGSDADPSLRVWSAIEQRELQEKDFIRSLIERISDCFESSHQDLNSSMVQLSQYALHLTQYRAALLLTELERIIRFKCVNLPSSVHDMHTYDDHDASLKRRGRPGELIAFLLLLLGDAVGVYSALAAAPGFQGQPVSKKLYPRIVSTVAGTAYFLSQFQPAGISAKMEAGCGSVLLRICRLCPGVVLSHYKVLLEKCLAPESEERGLFYMLQSIQYLDLSVDELGSLLGSIADVIRPPDRAWQRTAMLDLNASLRSCILRWMSNNPFELRAVYECAMDSGAARTSDFDRNVRRLLERMEPWGDGSKKRSAVWPTVCLLLCLVPSGLKGAILDRTARGAQRNTDLSVESKLFKRTLDHLIPDLKQIMFRNRNAHLFSELSIISLVLMTQNAATLLRVRASSDVILKSPSKMTEQAFRRGLSYDSILFFVDFFKKYNLDKLQDGILSGNIPSQLYQTMVTGQGNPVLSDSIRSEEFTPSSLFVAYCWSMFYINLERFFHISISILRPLNATQNITMLGLGSVVPNKFMRLNVLRSIECILYSGKVDGSIPIKFLWGSLYGIQLEYCVSNILDRFVVSSLEANAILGNGEFGSNSIHVKTRSTLVRQIHLSCHVDKSIPAAAPKVSRKLHRSGTLAAESAEYGSTRSVPTLYSAGDCGAHAVLCLRIIALNPDVIFMSRYQQIVKDFIFSIGKNDPNNEISAQIGNLELDNAMFKSPDAICVCLSLLNIVLCIGHEAEAISVSALSALTSVLEADSMQQWDKSAPIIGVINVSSVLIRTFGVLLFSTDGQIFYSANYRSSYFCRIRYVLLAFSKLLSSTNAFIAAQLSMSSAASGSVPGINRKSSDGVNVFNLNSAVMLAHYLGVQTAEGGLLVLICSYCDPKSLEEAEIAQLCGDCLGLLCDRNASLSVYGAVLDGKFSTDDSLRDTMAGGVSNSEGTVYSIYKNIAEALSSSDTFIKDETFKKNANNTCVLQLLSQILYLCIHRPSPMKEGEAGLGLVWAVQAIANRWKYATKRIQPILPIGQFYTVNQYFSFSDNKILPTAAGANDNLLSGLPTYATTWNSGLDEETVAPLASSVHYRSSLKFSNEPKILGSFKNTARHVSKSTLDQVMSSSCLNDSDQCALNSLNTALWTTQQDTAHSKVDYFSEWVRDMGILAVLGECLNICPDEFPQFDAVLSLSLACVEDRSTEEDIDAYMNPESIDFDSFLGDNSTPLDYLRRVVLKEKQPLLIPTVHELCSSDQLVEDLMNVLVHPAVEFRIAQTVFSIIGTHISSTIFLSLFSYLSKLLAGVANTTSLVEQQSHRRVSAVVAPLVEVVETLRPDTDVDSDPGLNDRSSHPIFVDIMEAPLKDAVRANIRDMTSIQVVSFLNASMMILLLIFGREDGLSAQGTNKNMPSVRMTDTTASFDNSDVIMATISGLPDFNRYIRESAELIEGILLKVISIASKAENETVSATSCSADFFLLQKKIASVIEAIVLKKKFKLTKRFRVFACSILLEWAYRGMLSKLSSTVNIRSTSINSSVITENHESVTTLSADDAAQLIMSVQSFCVRAASELLFDLNFSADILSILAETSSFSWINADNIGGRNVNDAEREKSDAQWDFSTRSKVFYRFFHILSAISTTYGISGRFRGQRFAAMMVSSTSANEKMVYMANSILAASFSALGNIIHANLDVGFHHLFSVAIGSTPTDVQIAVLNAFITVLQRNAGSEVELFGSSNKLGYEDHLRGLMGLLLSDSRDLLTVLCYFSQGKDAEILSRSVLLLCEESPIEASLMQILQHVIFIEVHNTEKLGTLFRSESMPTKMVNLYLSQVGKFFLVEVLTPVLQSFVSRNVCIDIESKSGRFMAEEVDGSISNAIDFAAILQKEADLFLQSIFQSLGRCPVLVQFVLKTIRVAVSAKFGESVESIRVVVAGSLFLRFFCPAIAMPLKYGVNCNHSTDKNAPLPKEIARGLLLIAKCLQHLVNCTRFTEENLLPMNSWIEKNSPAIVTFCDMISTNTDIEFKVTNLNNDTRKMSVESVHDGDADMVDIEVKGNIDAMSELAFDALSTIHAFIFAHKDSISKLLEAKHEQFLLLRKRESDQSAEGKEASNNVDLSTPKSILKTVDNFISSGHFGMDKYFELNWNSIDRDDSFEDRLPTHSFLVKILDQLGEPAVNPFTPVVESHRYLSNQSSKMLDNSIDDFLYSMESSPGFSQSLARVKDQNIFYVSNRGKSSAGGGVNEAIGPSPKNFAASVIWFVPRRVTESTKPLVLMYIILKEAKQLYQSQRSFDLIFDCTFFDNDNNLQTWPISSWWNKLRLYISDVFEALANKIFILHPSAGFVFMARQILKGFKVKTKIAIELCDIVSVAELLVEQPLAKEGCPYLTRSLADGIMYRWPALHNARPSTVAVSGKYLVMETPDTFGDVSIGYSAHSSVADFPVSAHQNKSLSSVHGSSPSIDLQQRVPNQTFMNQGLLNKPVAPTNPPSRRGSGANNSVSQRVTISYIKPPAKEIRAMILQSVQSVQLHSMLSAAMSTIKQQSQLDDLSAEADARVVRTEDISGILLHLAFFHMRSAESSLRKSGYSLLLALRHSYGLKISFPLFASESVFIPVLSSDFVVQLSGELSINHPELAVAFTSECVSCLGNSKISLKQKIACIQYLKPWIATFSNKVKSHNLNYEINELQANQKVLSNERFFDALLEVSKDFTDLATIIDQEIWTLVGYYDELGACALRFLIKRMYEHEGVNDMNKDIERTANIDPLLHDAMPMENDAWSMNSKGLNLACGETYINAETIDARDLSTSGRFGDADDASTYGADVTDARIMSPKSFTTSIKEAIHGTGSKTSVRNFHFKENDLNSNVSGNCYMSSNISNFTDAFQAIASQQKMLAIQLICHTLNEEIMKISILTHETGLSESSNRAVAEEAFTPQKRAADIRPKRVMKSASKDRNNHINSERGKESSTDSKYAFSRRKRFENFPTNPAAVTNLPFFACSFDHSSSDEFDDAVDELTQECGEDRLGSSDAINFHDYRGVNFDELLFSAKHLEMPSQFSDSSHHVTESEISQSNDLITADIVNDTANDLNIGFKISAELQLGLVDAEVLKFVFGREERRGTPLESPQLLSESLKCVDTPEREISRVHSQSWLRSVSHNRRTSSHYFSDRKKLVNNWNLPRVKSAVDNGSLDLDIDSMWNNVLRSTVFPRPLTDDTNVDSSAELKMHWDHVAVCFRNLIPLLFQNDDIVLKMRFELFHVVVCYLGRGPRRIRYGVQTLVINVVNSLYMWHLKQQDIKETNDVQATIAILHQKLAYFSSPAFRYVCCTAVDLSIPDVSEIIDGLVHIATSFTSPNYFLPDNNSTMDWLENNVYCICGLSPSPNCFRNVLAVNRIIAINEPGLNFPKYMSIIVKSLGAALMSSDGSAQNNALVDAVLKSLGDGAHRFSERLLQTVFWFSLIAIQFSPQNSLMYPLNLALDILLEISSRSSRDLEQKIFEEELIDTALSGSSSEFRNSSKSNRFVLIDILAELSRDNLLGVPLLSKSKLSYAISVLLIRCAHVTSSREICVRILIILDKMYIRRRGSEKYGISGYACMLQCIIGHNEPGCSDTSNEDCADNSSERGSNFFGAANFPTVTSAIQYATMLLCISRHFLSTAIKIRAHRFILSFIQAMPALGICLHQLIFEELTREFDSAAPSETEILKLIRQSLDVFFRFVLSSHPIGRYFNHLAPPDGIKKKLKAYERLIDNRSISYDEALGAEEASDEFAAVDESAVADVAFTSPPPSPHYSISSNQSTPVGSAHNDKWGQGDKLLQGDEPVSHLNEHVSILESTPAARENVIEGGVCKEIIHYFGAYNAIETMSLKTADQTAPAALPVRPQLISIGCDILRLAVLDLEDME